MARTRGYRIPTTHHETLAIRTRDSIEQNDIILPGPGESISTQADRCPFPRCINDFPHQHASAEGEIVPTVDEFCKAGEGFRQQWTEEQRRRIVENEALLRQVGELGPQVGNLSISAHLPNGTDLRTQGQHAVIHGGATPAQYAATREMLLDRNRQDIIGSTTRPADLETEGNCQTQADETCSPDWNDFPELDSKYGPPPRSPISRSQSKSHAEASTNGDEIRKSHYQEIDFLNTNPPCTGPCPIQCPHNEGAYLQQGQVPRLWNARWGYSDPPREIWEAWVRVEQGRGSGWDEVEVDGFALSHWWAGP